MKTSFLFLIYRLILTLKTFTFFDSREREREIEREREREKGQKSPKQTFLFNKYYHYLPSLLLLSLFICT